MYTFSQTIFISLVLKQEKNVVATSPVQNNIQFIKDLPRVREFWQWRHTPKVSF